MLTMGKALCIAEGYYGLTDSEVKVTPNGDFRLLTIYDSKEKNIYIVYAGVKDKPSFGSQSISIDKNTGEVSLFRLPNKDNFEILKRSKRIDLI